MGGFDPYSASKGATELITASYRDSFFKNNSKLPDIATTRIGNVIGGGDWSDDRIVPDTIKNLCKNQNVLIRNPNSKRPWQFILEPLSGILWLATKMYQEPKKFDEGWNFGPTKDTDTLTVKELVSDMIKKWNSNQTFEINNNLTSLYESETLFLDSSKAKINLGWKNILSIDNAISETISWYKTNEDHQEDIRQFTTRQIENYIIKAKQNNLIWT